MEVYEASDYYIIQNGNNYGLWCSRKTGTIEARPGSDLLHAWNPICLGVVYGIIGKIQVLPESDYRIILIKHQDHVGEYLSQHPVYRISKVAALPLNMKDPPSEFEIHPCKKHHYNMGKPKQLGQQGKQIFQSTISSIKSMTDSIQHKKNHRDPQKEQEKLEKRVLEELVKMFNFSDFYYYCPTADLTNSIQRQQLPEYDKTTPLWKRADDRFFWNKALLNDLISSNNPLADVWIQPIIQGFFSSEVCSMADPVQLPQSTFHSVDEFKFELSLISRRSRFRAGTRYKRRGVDVQGHCANYVETEQIVGFREHVVSYLQVRGSIPVYWSQPGHKYRPPPILDKGESDTRAAFEKHIEDQLNRYKHVTCISLVERQGREKVMADAFLKYIVLYNSPSIAYVAFDFHEYCRGMQFENVIMLTDAVKDILKAQKYCWVDHHGMICEQNGVFRVNCIDCLDRTNVVQSALAKIILEELVRKLGMLTPENDLPDNIKLIFNQLWANNGDAVSRQYAGTAAMKGDYTRTGERKFTGLMRDGVKSANRYLIHRFKDLYRQAAIDIQVGQPLEADVLQVLVRGQQEVLSKQDEIDYIREKASDVVSVIDECRNLLVMEPEQCMGGWGVISFDEDDSVADDEMDTILLLTDSHYYVVNYDDELDCLTHYQKISLLDLYAVDIGPFGSSVFRSKHQCIRVWYKLHGEAGYFHTFRVPNVRAFNNTVIEIKSEDEEKEILRAIADAFKSATQMANGVLNVRETKVEHKRFKAAPKTSIQGRSIETNVWNLPPQKIASMASSAVNNVRKQVASIPSKLKRLNISPRLGGPNSHRSTPNDRPHAYTGPGEDNLELFDDFSDQPDSALDDADTGVGNLMCNPLVNITEHENNAECLSAKSLPAAIDDETQKMTLSETRESLSSSSPQLQTLQPLANQTHHSTAPCLHVLDPSLNHSDTEEEKVQSGDNNGINKLMTPSMKISFSDDGLKNYTVVHSESDVGTSRSPFSKIKSSISQVSQLIVNQSSPHARRRKQVLEAQLLDNHIKSANQFKEMKTKILLL